MRISRDCCVSCTLNILGTAAKTPHSAKTKHPEAASKKHASQCLWGCLQYVDNLLATLAGFQPELQGLLQQLQNQVHLTAQASAAEAAKFAGGSKGQTGKRTMLEPFNLTQPKPKLLPTEEPMPPPIKSVTVLLLHAVLCCAVSAACRAATWYSAIVAYLSIA